MTWRKWYSAEFKREALRRANIEGVTDTSVAEKLGFSARLLRCWHDEAKTFGEEEFPGKGNVRDKEIILIKPKLAKVEPARNILSNFVN